MTPDLSFGVAVTRRVLWCGSLCVGLGPMPVSRLPAAVRFAVRLTPERAPLILPQREVYGCEPRHEVK